MAGNYESARKRFDPVIAVGKRVALAPHLDLWMQGTRYGTAVERHESEEGNVLWLVELDHRNSRWLGESDLLGALH